ncbi:ImmA/IrrE family metallo-endopeptidase [Pseudomonas sp. MF6755]|uniref:ImmA/IrrE family metallo-endopeptidase n=1 Tax=Pseudomonas sp. MF6755 TaxID=2797530 RepID=UPI0018E7E490|nr:ImmA/IrrE family metallo-endopeptidase [Pseudomonas sp. MF6755]MBJ2285831.1 ImmA/IrrE family metallo-endopeptidase [Pseudomonas sp. MF6755]
MAVRDIAMATAKVAAEVFASSRAMERIEQDGYTRIDPFRIAAGEGISVLLRPMEKLLGAFVREDCPGILVNSARSAGLIHMTCAHELGHYFMGHQSALDETIDYGGQAEVMEQEAETFGYHLLVPRPLLGIICKRKGWDKASLTNPHVLYQMSLRLGVSYSAAAWSLVRHKILAYDVVQGLLKVQPASIKQSLLQGQLPDASKDVWLFDEADQSSVLEPRPDDHLVVRLKSHASAGYLWKADSIAHLADQGFTLAPLESARPADPGAVVFGADSTLDYVLRANQVDAEQPHPVTLCEVRPWLGKQNGDASFNSKAHFEPMAEGLSRESKCALIQEVAGS